MGDVVMSEEIITINQNEHPTEYSGPLYLYVSKKRLILMSIASFGIYEAYWLYKNWAYIKQRDGSEIMPFWRALFGIFFCHSLFRRIHADKEAHSYSVPTFQPGTLATIWVILIIFGNILSRLPVIGILAPFIPSFLCLTSVQGYINQVTEKRDPNQPMHSLASTGHIICMCFGAIVWILSLIGLAKGL
jgi:hypothetical protein